MKKLFIFAISYLFVSPVVLAAGDATQGSLSADAGLIAIAVAIVMAGAVFGGAVAQGKVGAFAMEGIARNPQAQKSMFVPMIIALALIESLVIYALVIALQMVGKL